MIIEGMESWREKYQNLKERFVGQKFNGGYDINITQRDSSEKEVLSKR